MELYFVCNFFFGQYVLLNSIFRGIVTGRGNSKDSLNFFFFSSFVTISLAHFFFFTVLWGMKNWSIYNYYSLVWSLIGAFIKWFRLKQLWQRESIIEWKNNICWKMSIEIDVDNNNNVSSNYRLEISSRSKDKKMDNFLDMTSFS